MIFPQEGPSVPKNVRGDFFIRVGPSVPERFRGDVFHPSGTICARDI